MRRFVVLVHDHPFLHWDFLLEKEAALRSWRLLSAPDTAGEIVAEPLPDHRLMYLDYEGPVSGGRGEVRRWDRGRYRVEEESETVVVVTLEGERWRGRVELRRNAADELWTLRVCDGQN